MRIYEREREREREGEREVDQITEKDWRNN